VGTGMASASVQRRSDDRLCLQGVAQDATQRAADVPMSRFSLESQKAASHKPDGCGGVEEQQFGSGKASQEACGRQQPALLQLVRIPLSGLLPHTELGLSGC
jgi:hypothetical protein